MTPEEYDQVPYNTVLRVISGELKGRLVIDDDTETYPSLKAIVFVGIPIDAAFAVPPSYLEIATEEMIRQRKQELSEKLKKAKDTEYVYPASQVRELALDAMEYAMLHSHYCRVLKTGKSS